MLYSKADILKWLTAVGRALQRADTDRGEFSVEVVEAMADAVKSSRAIPRSGLPANATDLQRVQHAIAGMFRREGWLDELSDAVARAQNGPPDGAADDTLSEEQWYRAADVMKAAKDLRDALREWREADSPARYARGGS